MVTLEKIKIGDLFILEKGVLQSSKCTPGEYNFITAAVTWKTHKTFSHDCEAIVYAVAASGSLGRAHYVKGKFISSDLCFIMREKEKNRYPINFKFYHFILSTLRKDIVSKTKSGTSKESINQKNFSNYTLPYFDIRHQNYWEKKLTSVNNNIIGLGNLFNQQSTYLNLLRQSILQEAIEGKLTKEWRKNNPIKKGDPETDANALLEKIKAEKQKLINEGKIKKEKPLPPIKPEEIPFELPKGWVWCRLGEVTKIFAGYSFKSYDFKKGKGTKCIKITNAGVKELIETDDCLPESFFEQYREFGVYTDDLIISLTRPYISTGLKISKCIKSHNKSLLNQRVAAIRNIYHLNLDFLYTFMTSDFVLNGYKEKFEKVNLQPNLRMNDLTDLIIPFPSLVEQSAIAERVNSFFCKIGDLEKQLTERKIHAEELMQAVLREAFEGEDDGYN